MRVRYRKSSKLIVVMKSYNLFDNYKNITRKPK